MSTAKALRNHITPSTHGGPGCSTARWLGLAALCAGIVLGASGCASIGAVSGATAAAASGIATANPAVGVGVGIAVQAATDAAVKNVMRTLHADQQEVIAQTAGRLQVGGSSNWFVKHALPVENGRGKVRLLNDFSTALAQCREFAFSVQDGDEANAPEQWFTATACKEQGKEQDKWQWATAEPAVERWGALH